MLKIGSNELNFETGRRKMAQHPCKNCKAYHEPDRPQGRLNCPVLGRQIALEGCNRIAGANWNTAIKIVKEVK